MTTETHPMLVLANAEEEVRYQELEDLEAFRHGTADAPLIYRSSGYQVKADGDAKTMDFVASEESEDRFGDVIEVKGWKLVNFRRNPVFLFAHNSHQPPVGKVDHVGPNEIKAAGATGLPQLLASVTWDQNDPFAELLRNKYMDGFMRAVSVGFRPLEFKEGSNGGLRFTEQELLELSAVPVPAHPKALKKAFDIPTPDLSTLESVLARMDALELQLLKRHTYSGVEHQEVIFTPIPEPVSEDLPEEVIQQFQEMMTRVREG